MKTPNDTESPTAQNETGPELDCPAVTGAALSFGRCSDCDADCNEVKDPWACFSYDPERGYCPYLSGERKQIGQSDEQPK